jgi:carbamoyl-phosphate synthase large subunit
MKIIIKAYHCNRSKMLLRVLFTGGGGAGNEALWRLLDKRYEMHFADADGESFDPSIDAKRCHSVPFASDQSFVDSMDSLCRRLKIDLLIPGVDEELPLLAHAATRLAPTRLLLPPPAYVETMLDKLTSMRRLAASGIRVPRTEPLESPSDMPFPCIAKPRRGRGSRDVRVVNNSAEARALSVSSAPPHAGFILQELLAGDEFTVMMAADGQGRLAAVVPVRVGLKRGITLRARTDVAPAVIAACEAIHRAVPTSGCYNVQLIMKRRGEVLPFEINPRISTTFCLAIAAGIDPIAIFVGHYDRTELLPFRASVELRRHWRNYFSDG